MYVRQQRYFFSKKHAKVILVYNLKKGRHGDAKSIKYYAIL